MGTCMGRCKPWGPYAMMSRSLLPRLLFVVHSQSSLESIDAKKCCNVV